MKYLIYIFLFISLPNMGQETPGQSQQKSILLINGIAHIGDGTVINKSAIGIKGGKIVLVKDALTNTIDKSKYDTVIDITDHHVYPSFIAPNTTLGLQEIGAVRASKDQTETGTINPNVRSIVAYNTDSDITPTVRTNGVLVGQITPRGGVISGTSSVVHFDAWNWEDAVYRMDDGVHLNWPNVIKKSGWWAEPGPSIKNKGYSDKIIDIETFFNTAQAYSNDKKPIEKDLKLEAMRDVFNGNKSLYIHASTYKEINDVINFKKKYSISKVVIVGGHDAYLIAKKINENGISIILQRVHSLPERPEDDVYLPYKLPKLLNDANVLFCLENAGDMEQMGTRNLPFYGGTAVAYGLEYEQAIKSLTLNAAKILGVDNLLGSLTKGKDATLFISTGDALDMMTNDLTLAFVQGRMISLDNHQKRNYEKYKAKYEMK